MRTIFVDESSTKFSLNLDTFSVPSWWLLDFPTDPLNGEPNLSNVFKFRITTGDSTFSREEVIEVKSITLHGKSVDTETLYLGLLGIWISLSFLFIFIYLLSMKENAKIVSSRAKRLEKVNMFLQLEKTKYEKLAERDPLTSTLNRAGISPKINSALQLWTEKNITSSLIIFDIDDFKTINDKYGHDLGDKVLIELVNLIESNIRDDDFLARWGGEEFVIVCLKAKINDCEKLAEKLRSIIDNHGFKGVSVTCSFGVSAVCESVDTWFKKADKALY